MAVRSVRNNNPGNIRISNTDWVGKVQGTDTSFETFASPALGVRAMTRNLYSYQRRGQATVNEMINTWAPPSDGNDTANYAARVASAMGVGVNDPVDLRNNPELTERMVSQMIREEGGPEAARYFDSHVSSGIGMANGTIPPDADSVVPGATTDLQSEIPEVASAAQAAELAANQDFVRNSGQSLYEDNILNDFDSYTYNWGIHMVHPERADEFEENLEDGTYITIAQSGVENEISIEHVIQTMALTFQKEDRNSVANTFDITLVEAQGFTLINRMILAARELQIANHLEACFLLELNFKGWKGGSAETVGPFHYMTTLVKVDQSHRDSGTTYQTTFVETMQEAYNRNDYHLKSEITVTASTFGDFLTKFSEELNKETARQTDLSMAKLYPTQYELGTTPDAAEYKAWTFDAITPSNLEKSRNISVTAAGGGLQFTLSPGSAITSVMATAIYHTREFKKIPVGVSAGAFAKDEPDTPTAQEAKLADILRWITFETDVEYLQYDPIAKMYSRKITYNIAPYLVPEGIHDPVSFAKLSESTTLQRQRVDNILTNGLLKKRYDYTYTGLNTEVLNLDLTFNYAYFTLQPINTGAIQNVGAYTRGLTETQEEAMNIKSSNQSLQRALNSALTEKRQLSSELEQAREQLGSSDRALRLVAGERINELSGRLATVESQIADRRRRLEIKNTEIEQRMAEFRAANPNTQTTEFEALSRNYISQPDLYSFSKRWTDAIANTVQFDYNNFDSKATSGPVGDAADNVGAAMVGALELNLNSLSELVQQKLEVRGDPYWLGQPKGAASVNSRLATYSKGGVGYFLNVRFPTFDGEDGFMNDDFTNFSITALYRVIGCTAVYANGEFKMTLESYRDTNTNVPMMLEQLLSGKVSSGGQRSLSQRYIDNNNDGVDDITGETVPSDTSGRIDPAATGGDFGSVSGSTQGVDNRLLSALDTAAQQAGVSAVVSSGFRADADNPSGRHAGYAADVQLYSNGRLLSVENSEDLAIIQNYTQAYLDTTRAAGLTPSVGIGNPAYASGAGLYMSGTAFHYDIARTPGIGANLSAGAGPYWGGSGDRTRHHAPPAWLVSMYNS